MIHFGVTVRTPVKGKSAVLVKLLACTVAVWNEKVFLQKQGWV